MHEFAERASGRLRPPIQAVLRPIQSRPPIHGNPRPLTEGEREKEREGEIESGGER